MQEKLLLKVCYICEAYRMHHDWQSHFYSDVSLLQAHFADADHAIKLSLP